MQTLTHTYTPDALQQFSGNLLLRHVQQCLEPQTLTMEPIADRVCQALALQRRVPALGIRPTGSKWGDDHRVGEQRATLSLGDGAACPSVPNQWCMAGESASWGEGEKIRSHVRLNDSWPFHFQCMLSMPQHHRSLHLPVVFDRVVSSPREELGNGCMRKEQRSEAHSFARGRPVEPLRNYRPGFFNVAYPPTCSRARRGPERGISEIAYTFYG